MYPLVLLLVSLLGCGLCFAWSSSAAFSLNPQMG